jgi:hypothetical protein
MLNFFHLESVVMLRRQGSEKPTSDAAFTSNTHINKPFKKLYFLNLTGRHSRDQIIEILSSHHKGDEYSVPLITHLKKIGPDKFDSYSEIELVLSEYNVTLLFKMRLTVENVMTYTLPDLSLEPDVRLAAPAKRWFGLF